MRSRTYWASPGGKGQLLVILLKTDGRTNAVFQSALATYSLAGRDALIGPLLLGVLVTVPFPLAFSDAGMVGGYTPIPFFQRTPNALYYILRFSSVAIIYLAFF